MIHAYCTDGLDFDKREEFDRLLLKGSDSDDPKAKAARERDAVQSLLGIPGVAR